jgi:hypothetical protein
MASQEFLFQHRRNEIVYKTYSNYAMTLLALELLSIRFYMHVG